MKDYSQDREQLAILEALGGEEGARVNGGTVVELGAWNATTFSNSRALIECGWKAILVEPSPNPMLGLLTEYGNNPNVTLIQAAIGLHDNLVRMHITDDAVSTSEAVVYDQWKDATTYRGTLCVPVISLERFAGQFGSGEVWSIDCEGLSVDIFKRMMVLKMFPPVVVVEHDNRLIELLQTATGQGYKCSFTNATNVVLVHNQ